MLQDFTCVHVDLVLGLVLHFEARGIASALGDFCLAGNSTAARIASTLRALAWVRGTGRPCGWALGYLQCSVSQARLGAIRYGLGP